MACGWVGPVAMRRIGRTRVPRTQFLSSQRGEYEPGSLEDATSLDTDFVFACVMTFQARGDRVVRLASPYRTP
jgi:hypothetical protein